MIKLPCSGRSFSGRSFFLDPIKMAPEGAMIICIYAMREKRLGLRSGALHSRGTPFPLRLISQEQPSELKRSLIALTFQCRL